MDKSFKRDKFKDKGIIYQAMVPVDSTKQFQDIFVDFCPKDFPVTKKFFKNGVGYSRECDAFFKCIKRTIEKKYPNLILVINHPNTFNYLMTKNPYNQILFNVALHVPADTYSKSTFLQKYKQQLLEMCRYIHKFTLDELNKLSDAY
jgi:hypothetical protein